jgi:hypothetical protein
MPLNGSERSAMGTFWAAGLHNKASPRKIVGRVLRLPGLRTASETLAPQLRRENASVVAGVSRAFFGRISAEDKGRS